jgi:acetoin utilization deacetylase AcuC-like enzyme
MAVQLYYPDQIENVWHQSQTGESYRLDIVEKLVRLKDTLSSDQKFQITTVTDTPIEVLRLVHTPEYVEALRTGQSPELANSSGLLWQPALPIAYANSAQCLMQAASTALQVGSAGVISSGGHHAVPGRGFGFNPVNELAIAAKHLLNTQKVSKLAIFDLDIHYANGTNTILHDEPRVLNIDIWNKTLPQWQPVEDTNTLKQVFIDSMDSYWAKLDEALKQLIDFEPEIILYHSGMDVFENDRTGGIFGFKESKIKEREEKVFDFSKKNKIPIVLVVGGGYAHHETPTSTEISLQQLVKLHTISFESLASLQS